MPGRSSCSVLVLTEDAASDAHYTVCALAKKLLRLGDPRCKTHRIQFEPANDRARSAMRANRWKGSDHASHRVRVDLIQTIATKLLQQNGFVLFHFDADAVWSAKKPSENQEKFENLIRSRVKLALESAPAQLPADSVDRRLGRLVAMVPFHSIEAWLYQNTPVAIRICKEKHNGRDVAIFERWSQARHELDEVERPKETTCLQSRHNRALATTAFPAAEVAAVRKSFAAVVDAIRSSAELLASLMSTHSC